MDSPHKRLWSRGGFLILLSLLLFTVSYSCVEFPNSSTFYINNNSYGNFCRGYYNNTHIRANASGLTLDLNFSTLDGYNYGGIGVQDELNSSVIKNGFIRGYATGVKIARTSTILNITTYNNSDGIWNTNFYLQSSTIENCTIHSNTDDGILFQANHSYVRNNKIYNNSGSGISLSAPFLSSVSNNTIYNNTIYDNSEGIFLVDTANNNFIRNNTIYSNTVGINVSSGSDNTIYNNNISDNTEEVFDSQTNNWNTTNTTGTSIIGTSYIGGNWYGNNTACYDTDNDGFAELTYAISGGSNIDYLPLCENYDPTPVIQYVNLTPNSPTYANDLNCSFVVTDDINASVFVNITWWNGSEQYTGADVNYMLVTNNTMNYTPIWIKGGNVSEGRTWTCSVTAFDSNTLINLNDSSTVAVSSSGGGGGGSYRSWSCDDLDVSPFNIYVSNMNNIGTLKILNNITWRSINFEIEISDLPLNYCDYQKEIEVSPEQTEEIIINCSTIPLRYKLYNGIVTDSTKTCEFYFTVHLNSNLTDQYIDPNVEQFKKLINTSRTELEQLDQNNYFDAIPLWLNKIHFFILDKGKELDPKNPHTLYAVIIAVFLLVLGYFSIKKLKPVFQKIGDSMGRTWIKEGD